MSTTYPAADPLKEAVTALWPNATVRRVGFAERRTAKHADPVVATVQDLVIVPGGGGAGIALPMNPTRATARSMRRISAAVNGRQRATRMVLAGVSRTGAAAALPQRLEVTGSEEGALRGLLAEVFGEPVTFSVSVGTARVNRKPVLEVFGAHGTSRGFVKVGMGPVARRDVVTEARVLASLSPELAGIGLTVPEVLWSGVWQGMPVLVMTGVPQGFRQRRAERMAPPVAEMEAFTEVYAEPSARLAATGFFADVQAGVAAMGDQQRRKVAQRCLAELRRRVTGPIPFSAWHGDWVPWNMARHRGGLSVWDWERFETSVPAGLDRLHYAVNVATSRAGATRNAIISALARAQGGDDLTGLYLAAISRRYLSLATAPGGEVLAGRADCFLRLWEEWSR